MTLAFRITIKLLHSWIAKEFSIVLAAIGKLMTMPVRTKKILLLNLFSVKNLSKSTIGKLPDQWVHHCQQGQGKSWMM